MKENCDCVVIFIRNDKNKHFSFQAMFTHTEIQYDLEILHHGCDSPVYNRVVIGLRVLNTSTSLLSVSMESMALHQKLSNVKDFTRFNDCFTKS